MKRITETRFPARPFVQGFQWCAGLDPDGIIGPATRLAWDRFAGSTVALVVEIGILGLAAGAMLLTLLDMPGR
jgi:hypothetical protein